VKGALRYDEVRRNETERVVDKLGAIADIVIDIDRCTEEDVFIRVSSHLGLYGRGVERLVDVLVGGQYGSEGKGHIASYLAPEYHILLRVGGPNAGHKVYEVPNPYTFHHIPSGATRNPRAKLILGPGTVLWLPVLLKEIAECEISSDRLSIDPQAMVIEEADRVFEAKSLTGSIGSTGQGVGAATSRKVLRSGAPVPVRLARDVRELKPYLRESRLLLDDAFARHQRVFLEGTQGMGLSLHHGDYPFVTSRDTTVSGCLAEAGIAPSRVRKIMMVCRTYPIRVESPAGGSSGPMGTELTWAVIARRSGLRLKDLLGAERTSTTHRQRRVAEFGWTLLRRAASLNGPTDIALTFTDYISSTNRAARRFEQLTAPTIRFIEEIERVSGAPVSLVATRFHFRSIIDRRAW
jgi:adenylosuccinate synthase